MSIKLSEGQERLVDAFLNKFKNDEEVMQFLQMIQDDKPKTRDSIAYHIDHLTKEKIEIIKKKPIAVPVTGMAHLTTRDAFNGRLCEEVQSENCIMSKHATFGYYINYLRNLLEGAIGSDLYSYGSPFDVMVLNDSTLPEDPNRLFMPGNIIGYASRQVDYTGSSTLRGTPNRAEYSHVPGLWHLVMDFPTQAAVGNINSIWWCQRYWDSGDHPPFRCTAVRYIDYQPYDDDRCRGVKLFNDGTYIFMVPYYDGTTGYYASSNNRKNFYLHTIKPTYIKQIKTDNLTGSRGGTVRAGDYFNGEYYLLCNKGEVLVCGFDKDAGTFGVKREILLPAIPSSYHADAWYSAIAVKNNQIFTTLRDYNSTCMSKFGLHSLDGSLIKEVFHNGIDWNWDIDIYDTKHLVMVTGSSSNYICALDDFLNSTKPNNTDSIWNWMWTNRMNYGISRVKGSDNITSMIQTTDYSHIYTSFVEIIPPGAQTLLPATVKKLNTQTLKVVYDFKYEIF